MHQCRRSERQDVPVVRVDEFPAPRVDSRALDGALPPRAHDASQRPEVEHIEALVTESQTGRVQDPELCEVFQAARHYDGLLPEERVHCSTYKKYSVLHGVHA